MSFRTVSFRSAIIAKNQVMTEYRLMTAADIGAGLRLCRAAGWNHLERDWMAFLALQPGGSCVATQEANVVGTVTTISYAGKIGWIGMVLVDSGFQRQGIGQRLLKEAMEILHGIETIKLDATPVGREVYLKLGFKDEYGLSRMIAGELVHLPVSDAVAEIDQSEIEAVATMDAGVFGANRKELLQWLYNGQPSVAFVVKKHDEIVGYCLGRRGFNFFHIGPVAAVDMTTAKLLVAGAAAESDGMPVVLDVPHHHPEWINWLVGIGFREQRQFVRMFLGANDFPGEPKKQFAIVGPEFG